MNQNQAGSSPPLNHREVLELQLEVIMPISQTILPEFEHEMANTRKTLERVPDDKFAWKPHEKSMTLGGLATHLANIPSWTKNTFEQDELDVAPPGQPPYRLEEKKSTAEILAAFDENVASARAALEAATDENWQGKWSLLMGGKTIFTLPRTAVMRGFVLNHLIHHRAQLGVYLRLLDVPVPSIYGPSADEAGF
jgi:uncharacterized damage-inducible protein DinB